MITVFTLAFNEEVQHEMKEYLETNKIHSIRKIISYRNWPHEGYLESIADDMKKEGADALLLESANSMSKSDYEVFLKYAATYGISVLFADEENKKAMSNKTKEEKLLELYLKGHIDEERFVSLFKKIKEDESLVRKNIAVLLYEETEEQMSVDLYHLNSNLVFYHKPDIDALSAIKASKEIDEVYIKNCTDFECAGELAFALRILTEEGKNVHFVDQDITVDAELATKLMKLFEYY